jgi:hypothetical protein
MKQLEITDEQIKKAFEGKRFGHIDGDVYLQRLYVAQSIFKIVCDYGTGSTISTIMHELGLTKGLHGKPTKLAKQWAYQMIKENKGLNGRTWDASKHFAAEGKIEALESQVMP